MVLEATIVCVDTSDWMRNGDYSPSRMQAQADAVNLLAGFKTQDNPESSVGVLSYGGSRPRVLVALTQELGDVLSGLSVLPIGGGDVNAQLCKGVMMAQLALKHRQNKNQRQRVVLFIGSPIEEPGDTLVKLGKKLKKNSVALDIVDMASDNETTSKLESLLAAVNSSDNSHMVTVPAIGEGGGIVSDVIMSSPIFGSGEGGVSGFAAAAAAGAAAAANAAGGAGAAGFDQFGVDPNLDPELALALRVSMEEERARQQANKEATAAAAAAAGTADAGASGEGAETMEADAAATGDGAQAAADDVEMMDEDVLLQQALAMSMGQQIADVGGTTAADDMGADDEDDELAAALQMSLQQANTDAGSAPTAGEDNLNVDAAYVAGVLGSLPGVDANDPAVQAALAGLNRQQGDQTDDKNEEDDEKME